MLCKLHCNYTPAAESCIYNSLCCAVLFTCGFLIGNSQHKSIASAAFFFSPSKYTLTTVVIRLPYLNLESSYCYMSVGLTCSDVQRTITAQLKSQKRGYILTHSPLHKNAFNLEIKKKYFAIILTITGLLLI